MKQKKRVRKTNQKKKQTVYFLLFIIFLIILYLSSYYYFIYHNELAEQKKIEYLMEISFDNTELSADQSDNMHSKPNTVHDKSSSVAKQQKDIPKINNSNEATTQTDNKTSTNADSIWIGDCILIIPDIDLKKIVYTGKDRTQHLENYELITASDNMKYKNGGNYIICGHASRLYGHSLNRLKEIKKGASIQIQTKDKLDEYIVNQITYENMNQTSQYCNQTQENTLTIISCAKYISEKSYIVIHAKRK